jgi:hypothetical protein
MSIEIDIKGEPASLIVKRALERGLIWKRDDPRSNPNRLTDAERERLVKGGLIRIAPAKSANGKLH